MVVILAAVAVVVYEIHNTSLAKRCFPSLLCVQLECHPRMCRFINNEVEYFPLIFGKTHKYTHSFDGLGQKCMNAAVAAAVTVDANV